MPTRIERPSLDIRTRGPRTFPKRSEVHHAGKNSDTRPGAKGAKFRRNSDSAEDQHPSESVVIAFVLAEDPAMDQLLRDLAALAGIEAKNLSDGSEPPADVPAVLIVEAGVQVPSGLQQVPQIVVAGQHTDGDKARDVTIPGEEVLLIELISSLEVSAVMARASKSSSTGTGPSPRFASVDASAAPVNLPPSIEIGSSVGGGVILVASWHGGGGATTVCFAVANALSGVVIDASANSGCPPGRPSQSDAVDALTWNDLDFADLPSGREIVSALPRVLEVPTLASAGSASVSSDAESLATVVRRLPRVAVIDCGTQVAHLPKLQWHLALAGCSSGIVLVGKPDESLLPRLIRSVAAVSPLTDMEDTVSQSREISLLVRGRTTEMFRSVTRKLDLYWRRAPRPANAKGWKRVAQALAAAAGE